MRIVDGLWGIAPLVLGLGCEGPRVEHTTPPPAVKVVEHKPVETSEEPKPIGKFDITFYYVVGEDEVTKRAVRKRPSMYIRYSARVVVVAVMGYLDSEQKSYSISPGPT